MKHPRHGPSAGVLAAFAALGLARFAASFSFGVIGMLAALGGPVGLVGVLPSAVGGNLLGNARWLGVRLDDLLAEAGIDPAADQIVGRSIDRYTCGFPVAALDDRDALVAIGMNG